MESIYHLSMKCTYDGEIPILNIRVFATPLKNSYYEAEGRNRVTLLNCETPSFRYFHSAFLSVSIIDTGPG